MTLLATIAGFALGVATMFLQGILPGALNQLANSGAVWVAGAFLAGALLHRKKTWVVLFAGAFTQLGAVVGYYWSVAVRYHQGVGFWFWVWVVAACGAGPLFGWAGAAWRSGRHATLGSALLVGVFLGEGAYLLLMPNAAGWIMLGLGLVAGLALRRLWGLVAGIPVGAVVLLGYEALNLLPG